MTLDSQGGLHVPVTRVNVPCSECGSTNYPNLKYSMPEVEALAPGMGTGVLCRKCLNTVVAQINQALKATNTDDTSKGK
jgi:hypothetical protein